MSIKNLPRWNPIAAPSMNPTGTFSVGASLVNKAFDNAQGAITKHQQDMEKMDKQAEIDATSKLLEINAANGKLTQKDYDSVGEYDAKLLNDVLEKRSKRDLDTRNIESQILERQNKLGFLDKEAAKFKSAKALLQFKKDNNMGPGQSGKGTAIDKILNDANIIYDPFDSSKSTADGDRYAEARSAVAALKAKGVKSNDIKAAVAANSKSGGFWGEVGPWDEQTLDIPGLMSDLKDAGYQF